MIKIKNQKLFALLSFIIASLVPSFLQAFPRTPPKKGNCVCTPTTRVEAERYWKLKNGKSLRGLGIRSGNLPPQDIISDVTESECVDFSQSYPGSCAFSENTSNSGSN